MEGNRKCVAFGVLAWVGLSNGFSHRLLRHSSIHSFAYPFCCEFLRSMANNSSSLILIPKILPTKIPWVEAANCSCPLKYNKCYRPSIYSKPVLCVHHQIWNIDGFLSKGPIEVDCVPEKWFLIGIGMVICLQASKKRFDPICTSFSF